MRKKMLLRDWALQEGMDFAVSATPFRKQFVRWSGKAHPNKMSRTLTPAQSANPHMVAAVKHYSTKRMQNMGRIDTEGVGGEIEVHPDPRQNLEAWEDANPDVILIDEDDHRRRKRGRRIRAHKKYSAESNAARLARDAADMRRYDAVRERARREMAAAREMARRMWPLRPWGSRRRVERRARPRNMVGSWALPVLVVSSASSSAGGSSGHRSSSTASSWHPSNSNT